ncbi:ZmpA/ZmpB/ZmpC family metallo-endopeptidase [Gemelliphila palaticanis]|uniref:YSIRK-type signal peptide-containing protein n=1 Tax=Gemelliphila palaticanis TaxID=81950 RepID=A0ABX2T3P4_9BACL|nr:ZmpA/ZmpB/ZmpC family metallo-endopeptidase [Gemella palaticanis]MBF0716139.1 YSIRK-type signal peptide-containing protein [Gemella palaticanis]NYS48069.1 YSIRK-type signal peptide-containing protein [Gemella palaticanis]
MDFKKKQKFSIRKLTLGTVSVFLGATLVLGNKVVEANELEKTEQKSEEKVKIGYLGVDEKDLNDIEKKLIEKKDITEEVAKENDTYVVVYRGKEAVKNVLPKTGLSGNILNLLIAGGLILCIYRLGKKKSTLIGIVLVTAISGVTSLKTIKAEEVLKEIFRNTIVYKENSNLEKLDLDNFEYLGYIKDENIPTNTRLYKLVEEYKTTNLLEKELKEEEKSAEKVDKLKKTESVEVVKQDSTVLEKPKEEKKPAEKVEEGNSNSIVEEKPSEEANPTEEEPPASENPTTNVTEGTDIDSKPKTEENSQPEPSTNTESTEEVTKEGSTESEKETTNNGELTKEEPNSTEQPASENPTTNVAEGTDIDSKLTTEENSQPEPSTNTESKEESTKEGSTESEKETTNNGESTKEEPNSTEQPASENPITNVAEGTDTDSKPTTEENSQPEPSTNTESKEESTKEGSTESEKETTNNVESTGEETNSTEQPASENPTTNVAEGTDIDSKPTTEENSQPEPSTNTESKEESTKEGSTESEKETTNNGESTKEEPNSTEQPASENPITNVAEGTDTDSKPTTEENSQPEPSTNTESTEEVTKEGSTESEKETTNNVESTGEETNSTEQPASENPTTNVAEGTDIDSKPKTEASSQPETSINTESTEEENSSTETENSEDKEKPKIEEEQPDSEESTTNTSEEVIKEIGNAVIENYRRIEYKSEEIYSAAGYRIGRNTNYSHLDTLLLEDSFNKNKETMDSIIPKLAKQLLKSKNKEEVKRYLEDNKAKISLGLAYFSRWYNINFNENNNFKDKLLFEYENYGNDSTLAEFLVNIRENISSDLKEDAYLPENNDKLYKEKVSKITKANTIYEFLKQNVQKYNKEKDFNTWFKEHSKAYIVEEQHKNIPLEVKISERLNKEDFQRIYLPLLTMSGSGLYVIPTATSITFGDMETYINKNIDKNSEEYKKELEKVKELVRIAAKNQTMHFDFWYRVALDNVKKVLVDNKVIILDSFLNKSDKKWTAKYGNNSTLATREFFAPSGRYHNRTTSADAFSNGDIITFSETLLLSLQAGSIWTHEVTHALEDKVHLGGNGLRPGIGQESYAEGLFQSVRDRNRNSIGLNVYSELTNKDKEVLKNINTTPERFKNAEDLKTYMHNLLDVIYVLDIAEANSLFKNKDYERAHMIAKMTGIADEGTEHNRDSVLPSDVNNSLKTIEDLVDNNIVITRTDFKGAVTITNGPEAGRNTYVSVPLFSPMYGLLENDKGSSGGYTFRRVAWELLAHKGYKDGMIPYISDKYAGKARSEGKEFSDSYIVNQIFKDDSNINNLKDFKKAMFKERQDKLSELKSVTINYEGKTITIKNFSELQQLMDKAFRKDLIDSWNKKDARKVFDLKQAIFLAYLKQTNDFNMDIFSEKP